MPTLGQQSENIARKIKKFGPDAHCNQLFVSEELRAAAIANAPDAEGRKKTRIGLQTYSPQAYSDWNAAIEYLMERCGCNPLIVVDLLLLFVQEAKNTETDPIGTPGRLDGIDMALQGLFKGCDYEQKLRQAKEGYRKQKKARSKLGEGQ